MVESKQFPCYTVTTLILQHHSTADNSKSEDDWRPRKKKEVRDQHLSGPMGCQSGSEQPITDQRRRYGVFEVKQITAGE